MFWKRGSLIGGDQKEKEQEKDAHPSIAFQCQNYCYYIVHQDRKVLHYYNALMPRLLQDLPPLNERITLLEDALLDPRNNNLVLFLTYGQTGMHFGRGTLHHLIVMWKSTFKVLGASVNRLLPGYTQGTLLAQNSIACFAAIAFAETRCMKNIFYVNMAT